MKKVVVLHEQVPPEAELDEQDVLVEVDAVSRALARLGYQPLVLPLSLDAESIASLKREKALFVFNLVESLEGTGRLLHIAPALLDSMRIPYTGNPTEAMFITSNKLLTKKLLKAFGVATPAWASSPDCATQVDLPCPAILKSMWEHASVGLDEHSVILQPGEVRHRLRSAGADFFVERFVDGREFNLALLGSRGDGVDLLPPAEIEFIDFPPEKPRIVGYRAKWHEDSFEYEHTVRRYDFDSEERPLLEKLAAVARRCWEIFELRGYARVDFRVDREGQPWVLEINANPCISPDAGFVKAAERAGLDFDQVISRIIESSGLADAGNLVFDPNGAA